MASGAVLAIGGAVLDFGLKYLDSGLEKGIKKFTYEYDIGEPNTKPKFGNIPNILVDRIAKHEKGQDEKVYSFSLTPKKVNSSNESFYYEFSNFDVDYSQAKITKGNQEFDLVLELVVVGQSMIKGKPEIKTFKSGLMKIKLINTKGGTPIYERIKSSIIPRGIILLEIQIKITESNTSKISADVVTSSLLKSGEKLSNIVNVISENVESNGKSESGND